MDIYNIKELGKKTKINDDYWKKSLSLSEHFEECIETLSDEQLKRLIKDPYLYKGKA